MIYMNICITNENDDFVLLRALFRQGFSVAPRLSTSCGGGWVPVPLTSSGQNMECSAATSLSGVSLK